MANQPCQATPLSPSATNRFRARWVKIAAHGVHVLACICATFSFCLASVAAHAVIQIAKVGAPSDSGFGTSLALKAGNVPVIAYVDLNAADITLATCTATCTSATPTWQIVTVDNDDVTRDPSLALNSAGNPIISYYDFTNGNLKLATCTANCTSASPTWQIVVVDGATANVGAFNSLDLDGSGRPVISYYDATNSNLKLATCTANCATATPSWQIVTVDNGANDVGQYTSLQLNASNRPVISYYDATAKKLKLATCTASCATATPTWQIVTVSDAAADVGKASSLKLTLFGNPIISYRADDADDDLKLATCTAGCTTASPTWQIVTVDSVGNVGSSSSLAIQSNGNPIVSYYKTGIPGELWLATCTANCASASPTWQLERLGIAGGQDNSLRLSSTGDPLVSGPPIISHASTTHAVDLVTIDSPILPIALTSNRPGTTIVGMEIILTATMPATDLTGTINFRNVGGASVAGCAAVALVPNGTLSTASCTFPVGSAGSFNLEAVYVPGNYLSSTSNSVAQNIRVCDLDIEGSGTVRATTDGMLILRRMFSLSGSPLVANVRELSPPAQRIAISEISEFIDSMTGRGNVALNVPLDLDGNGVVEASTDGLLLLRALLGFTGNSVTDSALGSGVLSRSSWAQIRIHLNATCGTNLSP